MGSNSARKSVYVLRNDRASEYAIVIAHGADHALDILLKNEINWRGLIGRGVTITCAQHGVDDEPELIWFGFYGGMHTAERPGVQMNFPKDRSLPETPSNADQKQADGKQSP
jgi:hypothetical protein